MRQSCAQHRHDRRESEAIWIGKCKVAELIVSRDDLASNKFIYCWKVKSDDDKERALAVVSFPREGRRE